MTVEQTFNVGPNCADEKSIFVGEDIRSAKVYRHLDLPIPAIIYQLKDNRIAKAVSRFGGMAVTITIYPNLAAFENEYMQKICIHDPETGKLWSK